MPEIPIREIPVTDAPLPASAFLRPAWPAPAWVCAAFTTRLGGHGTGPWGALNLGTRVGDDPGRVAANREAVARSLGLPAPPQWLQQIHGADLVTAAADGLERVADACWTRQHGVVCAVQSADCLPILLCDRAGSLVAAVHAGWRGLAGGILQRVLIGLGVAPGGLLAWLGPAICGRCYEVGAEVRAAFCAAVHPRLAGRFRPADRPGHWLADLPGIARDQLQAAGVPAAAIHGGDLCTFEDPGRFYSHRRDGPTGRMAALIWLAAD